MRKISSILILLIPLIFNYGCEKFSRKGEPGPGDNVHPVAVAVVVSENIPDIVELKGSFIPSQRLDIKGDLSGKVQALSVTEGQKVSSGEVLIKVDDENLPLLLEKQRAELKEAEAQLEFDTRLASGSTPSEEDEALDQYPNEEPDDDENRVEEEPVEKQPAEDQENTENQEDIPAQLRENLQARYGNRVVPGQNNINPETAEGRLALDQAKIDRLGSEIALSEKQLAGSTMLATFEGIVSKVRVTEGSSVKPDDVLLEVVAINPIDLVIDVPIEDSSKVSMGLEAKVVVPDLAYSNFSGQVSFISPEIDTGKKSLQTKIRVTNPDSKIKAGMQGITQLAVSKKSHKALLIPGSAIVSEGNRNFVYQVEGQYATRQPIEIGASFQSMVEVKKGLTADEKVVSVGAEKLKEKEEFIKIK
jgi:RND family efflux transporter MFP subunit